MTPDALPKPRPDTKLKTLPEDRQALGRIPPPPPSDFNTPARSSLPCQPSKSRTIMPGTSPRPSISAKPDNENVTDPIRTQSNPKKNISSLKIPVNAVNKW